MYEVKKVVLETPLSVLELSLDPNGKSDTHNGVSNPTSNKSFFKAGLLNNPAAIMYSYNNIVISFITPHSHSMSCVSTSAGYSGI